MQTQDIFSLLQVQNTVGWELRQYLLLIFHSLDSSIFGMEQARSNFNNNKRHSAVTQVHKFLFRCLQQNHHLNQTLLKKCWSAEYYQMGLLPSEERGKWESLMFNGIWKKKYNV